jgi:hypothetical protein
MVDYSSTLPQLLQFQAPNRLAMAQQAGQLQAQQIQLAKAQQEMDAQNQLRSLDRKSPEFVNQLYAMDPAKGQAYEKNQFDMAEAQRRRGEASTTARAASQAKVLDNAYAPFTRLVNNVQSPDDAAAFVTALYGHPVLGAEAVKIKPVDQAIQDSQKEFMADPDKWRLLHGNLDGKTIYQISQAATAPKIEKIDLGGAIKFIDMNPKSATFKQEMGDYTKTPAPRAAAPEQTSGVAEPQVNNLAPAPTTSAFDARAAGPVQLAMLGGGGAGISPLLQMARPLPSDGGVLTPVQQSVPAPTRAASRTRRPAAEVEPEVLTTEDEGPPLPKLTPAQELKLRDQVAKDYEKAVAGIAGASGVLEAAGKVRTAKGLSGVTGIVGLFPSAPDSPAAIAGNRIENLKGKVTLMGKSAAAATGAIGSIANQEWKILRDMVASLDKFSGEKALREQIEEIENQARGAEARIRDAYEKHHEQTVRRPAFKTYKDLPALKTFVEPDDTKKPPRRGTLTPAPQSAPAKPLSGTVDFGSLP